MRPSIWLSSLMTCSLLLASSFSLALPFTSSHSLSTTTATPLSELFYWDPFKILEQIPMNLEKEEKFFVSPARVDWKETENNHLITVEVPGLKKDELKIEVEENRVLRVTGERRKEEEEEKKNEHWHRVERFSGKFWRQFRLPDNVDMDSINAKLENGVLTISVSKLSPDRVKGPKVVSIEGTEEKMDTPLLAGEAKQEL